MSEITENHEDDVAQKTEMWAMLKSMDRLKTDEQQKQDSFWSTEDGLATAKEFMAAHPRRLGSINELRLLNGLCMMLIEEGKKTGNGIPMNLCIEGTPKTKMSKAGFMMALFYQEGLVMGLKGKEMLDFVYKKSKDQHNFFKGIVEIHERGALN